MVMDLFHLPPDFDEEVEDSDAEETDEVDEVEDSEADGENSEEDEGDEAGTDGPVTRAKYDADMTAMRQMVKELKATVGRSQSIAARLESDTSSEEIRAELRKQQSDTTALLATIVSALDPTVVDPKVLAQIKATQDEIADAAKEEAILAKVRKEAGIDPRRQAAAQEFARAQAMASNLEAELTETIESFGLDPDDGDLFDWEAVRETLKEGLQSGDFASALRDAKRTMTKAIATAMKAQDSTERRETRRTAAGTSARGTGPKSTKDPLTSGTLAERKAALDALMAGKG